MRSIVSLATLAGMVLLNLVSTAFGQIPDVVKVPAPPPPLVPIGGTYEVYVIGATSAWLPEDTVGYEFDLLFNTEILSLISTRDSLVGDDTIDISPLPNGLRLSAFGSRAEPDDLINTLLFSADQLGATEISVNPLTFYAASGPGGEITAFPLPPTPGFILLTVVPEPSSFVLAGIGFALLVSVRRRHSKRGPPG